MVITSSLLNPVPAMMFAGHHPTRPRTPRAGSNRVAQCKPARSHGGLRVHSGKSQEGTLTRGRREADIGPTIGGRNSVVFLHVLDIGARGVRPFLESPQILVAPSSRLSVVRSCDVSGARFVLIDHGPKPFLVIPQISKRGVVKCIVHCCLPTLVTRGNPRPQLESLSIRRARSELN